MYPTPWRAVCACLSLACFVTAPAQTPPDNLQVFLLIGQSNMAGRGQVGAEDKVPHPRVFMLTKDLAWVPAVDPMHYDMPKRIGTGLGRTFGIMLAEASPGVAVGLVPAAFGGSGLDEWTPGQPHYVNAVARAKAALKQGRLAGILWHQGETDSAPDKAATYVERFARMIAHLRADLDSQDVPVIVGETGRFRPNGAAVNAAIARLPEFVPHCVFVSAEGLTDQGDQLHFDSASFRELGRRYAVAWQALQPVPVMMLQPVMIVPKKKN
jgi:hypothetical protein